MALNIKKSTAQRIYEYALKHVRKQGVPGVNAGGTCVYRTDAGPQCAVGAMLTDDQLFWLGGANAGSVQCHRTDFITIAGSERKLDLLVALQDAHDCATDTEGSVNFLADFEAAMQIVATEFELRYTPPGVSMRT